MVVKPGFLIFTLYYYLFTMKKIFFSIFLFLLCLVQLEAAEQGPIRISTAETDLILRVAPNGRVYQSYLGSCLLNESEFGNLPIYVRSGSDDAVSTRGWEIYPCSGAEDYYEPAFGIQHNDGNMTSIFRFVSSDVKKMDDNVTETIISMKDDVYPVNVKIHYITYARENIIKTWTEISHNEKKPVSIFLYASSMLYFESP